MTDKFKIIAGAGMFLVVFLAGFIPQYLEKRSARTELEAVNGRLMALEADMRMAELRDVCGMMLLEVLQQNYGLVREHSTQYFERVRQAAEDPDNPVRERMAELLTRRDSITALLAQSDPASSTEVQTLCRDTHQVTGR